MPDLAFIRAEIERMGTETAGSKRTFCPCSTRGSPPPRRKCETPTTPCAPNATACSGRCGSRHERGAGAKEDQRVFRRSMPPGLDPGVDAGSRQENATKQGGGAIHQLPQALGCATAQLLISCKRAELECLMGRKDPRTVAREPNAKISAPSKPTKQAGVIIGDASKGNVPC